MGSLDTLTFLVPVLLWMWLAMMLVHELGHVAAAQLTGATITSLELRPGPISHTLAQPNPNPGVVVWAGFVVGWVAPQLTAPAWAIRRGLIGPVLRAWAAFCLLAGGTYLAVGGGGDRFTDTGLLRAEGWPLWLLIAIGASVAAVGYWRSRPAWIRLIASIRNTPPGWRVAAGWWAFLAAWCAGQGGLHSVLCPH